MEFGITRNGFTPKRLEDIKYELETRYKERFGTIRTDPESNFGQLIGVQAEALSLLWEQVQNIYNASYPSTAEGVALDNILHLNGLQREEEMGTTVSVGVMVDDKATLPKEFRVADEKKKHLFQINNEVTIDYKKSNEMVFSIDGDLSKPDSQNPKVYSITIEDPEKGNDVTIAVQDSAIASSFTKAMVMKKLIDHLKNRQTFNLLTHIEPFFLWEGSLLKPEEITNDHLTSTQNAQLLLRGTVQQFSYKGVQNLSPYIQLGFTALQKGALILTNNQITKIITPHGAVDKVANFLPGNTGRDAESDDEARKRRLESLMVAGSSTVEAIRSRLMRDVADIGNVSVIEYDEDKVTSSGDPRPAHSIECIVEGEGGSDTRIAQVIFESKAAGILTTGTRAVDIADDQKLTHTIRFSRTEAKVVTISMKIETDASFPEKGKEQIKENLANYGTTLGPGEDLLYQKLFAPIYNVPGVIEVTELLVEGAKKNLDIDERERAVIHTDNITIN